jgi:DNA-binding beta-propeller fold protein YncE
VRKVSLSAGWLSTPAGTGAAAAPLGDRGPAARAFLDGACGVAVDHAGNLVIADTGDQRVRVVAASAGMFYGQSMTAGDIYTVAGDGIRGFSGDGRPATSAELNLPDGVAADGGNLVTADTTNNRIRVIAG